MPDYKTHIVFGYFSVALIFGLLHYFKFIDMVQYLDIKNIIYGIIVIFFASIMADLDSWTSKITQWFILFATLSMLLGYLSINYNIVPELRNLMVIGLAIQILVLIVVSFKHRGITHTIFASLLFSVPMLFIGTFIFFVSLISYLSHLIIDGELEMI